MNHIIELSVKNFKAVKSADISLDGITVVAGINGCGKSTLSQLLYYSFYNANRFDELVDDYLFGSLSLYTDALRLIQREIRMNISSIKAPFMDSERISVKDKSGYIQELASLFDMFLQCKEIVASVNQKDKTDSFYRVVRIIEDTLNLAPSDISSDGLQELLKTFIETIEEAFDNALKLREQRDYKVLKIRMDIDLKHLLPREWLIKEYGVPLTGDGVDSVPLLHAVKRVAYVDTPMLTGIYPRAMGHKYWNHLLELLADLSYSDMNKELYADISQIINGESLGKEEGLFRDTKLVYKRNDGAVFDLDNCATGIKAFSILQLLLKNGFLQKDTLLIIDEPEAHLHPQWIVEYARMIVLLNKKIGVKFFIASHSTDMVSAIRYIAAKEKTEEKLSFYLAEKSKETPYEYDYRNLGLDIDPIFQSFNKSFDKIDEYGVSE